MPKVLKQDVYKLTCNVTVYNIKMQIQFFIRLKLLNLIWYEEETEETN